MFHNSTTLHHSHSQSFALGKEKRLVYIGWLAQKKMVAAVGWEYMRPLRKVARVYSWAFGWPLITKGADLAMKGLDKTIHGAELAAHTALEGGKGVLQMTAEPIGRLVYSRLVALKRFLVDVPIATVSAAIRTPIALAKSPLEMIRGVRSAISSVPGNVGEIFNSIREFSLMDTLRNTRKAVTDVLLPPITMPVKPIFTPTYELGKTIFDANWQTVQTARSNLTQVVPNGARKVWNAPNAATVTVNAKRAERAAAQAVIDEEKKAKDDAWRTKVAAEMNQEVANSNGKSAGKAKAA